MLLRRKRFSGDGITVTIEVKSHGKQMDRVPNQTPYECARDGSIAVCVHVLAADQIKKLTDVLRESRGLPAACCLATRNSASDGSICNF